MDSRRQLYCEKIQQFCLMDDTFMSKVFEDKKCAELLLKIILEKDLHVKKAVSQFGVKNLQGRSVRLDIFAEDDTGIQYNIEVQREDSGAIPERARYNSSLIDANVTDPGEDLKNLPECYVIFITENDVLNGGLPLYSIERTIRELDHRNFNDRSHIIYVNGSIRDETALGKLMQDFFCKRSEDMHYKELSERTGFFKNDEEGEDKMCEIMEEIRLAGYTEGEEKGKIEGERGKMIETALNMLRKKKYSIEEISEISGMSVDDVNKLAEENNL